MIVDNEPFFKYNVRMGDPECQTLVLNLKQIFLISFKHVVREHDQIDIEWSNKKSLCIVLCTRGYPHTYDKNLELKDCHLLDYMKMNLYSMLELTLKTQRHMLLVGEY